MSEELAVISDVGIGMRDCVEPVLWFTTDGLHMSALQILNWDKAKALIQGSRLYDVKKLEGKTCVVEAHDGFMLFIRLKS